MGMMKRLLENAEFDGATYEPARDRVRLTGQLQRVYAELSRGGWWSLTGLATTVGGSEAGVSARLRDLRKERFGGHIIERKSLGDGRWRYRLIVGAGQ